MAVSISDIADFFAGENERKQIRRGENSLKSNRLESFIFLCESGVYQRSGESQHEGQEVQGGGK